MVLLVFNYTARFSLIQSFFRELKIPAHMLTAGTHDRALKALRKGATTDFSAIAP